MSYTQQLEQETEQTRQQLATTLDVLRARITPGQIADQVVDYATNSGGAEFLHNLKRQAVRNPLPLTLMGAGLAWLMMSNGTSGGNGMAGPPRRRLGRVAEGMSEAAAVAGDSIVSAGADMADSARSTAASIADRARASQARMGEAARTAAASVKDTMSSSYETMASAYGDVSKGASRTAASVADSVGTVGRGAAATSRSFAEFCRDQPLILAGIGIALGAALGAILPPTETEDRLMGKASDDAKEGLGDLASEGYDKASAIGERALEAAREEAEKQGLAMTPSEREAAPDEERLPGAPGGALRKDDSAPGELWH